MVKSLQKVQNPARLIFLKKYINPLPKIEPTSSLIIGGSGSGKSTLLCYHFMPGLFNNNSIILYGSSNSEEAGGFIELFINLCITHKYESKVIRLDKHDDPSWLFINHGSISQAKQKTLVVLPKLDCNCSIRVSAQVNHLFDSVGRDKTALIVDDPKCHYRLLRSLMKDANQKIFTLTDFGSNNTVFHTEEELKDFKIFFKEIYIHHEAYEFVSHSILSAKRLQLTIPI